MSAFGTKRTSRHTQPMSAFGGKADIARTLRKLHGRDDRSAVVVLGRTLYSERRSWTPSRGQTMMRDTLSLGPHQWTWWFGCGDLVLESMRLRSAKTRLTKRFFRA